MTDFSPSSPAPSPPSAPQRHPGPIVWRCAVVVVLTLAAYWPSLNGRRVWDDDAYITRGELQSLHGLHRIWTELGATEQYYPLLHTAFWVEHRLWGDAPLGYHLLNVLLHATSACLFAFVLIAAFESKTSSGAGSNGALDPASNSVPPIGSNVALPVTAGTSPPAWPWFAALLFALHPVCVESVAWMTEQKNTLSTVFYLASALLYLRQYDEPRPPARPFGLAYWAATVLFVLALAAKTVTATLPAALLLVLGLRQGRLALRRDILPLSPWFVLGAAGGLFSGWVERTYIGAHGSSYDLTFLQRLLVSGRMIVFYLGKLVWPAKLTFHYPRWTIDPGQATAWLPLLAAVAVTAWAVARSLRTPSPAGRAPAAAWFFFVGSLFPTLGFFAIYAFIFSYVADHWDYLACLGILALAAAAWARWTRQSRPIAIAVLALLGLLTWRQNRLYADPETLYRATLRDNPDAWMIQDELANLLVARGQPAEAAEHFRRAIAIQPTYAQAHDGLGGILLAEGRLPDAIAEFRATLALRPDATDAHVNLASALARTGQPAEAVGEFEAAIRLGADGPEVENNLANALAAAGRLPEAMARYQAALRLDPAFADAHINLANALTQAGRLPEALSHYEAALRLNPRSVEARFNWAIALLQAGRLSDAESQLAQAAQLAPGNALVWSQWGTVLAQQGRLAEAENRLASAVRLAPSDAGTRANFGWVLLQEGKTAAAAAQFDTALKIDPTLASAREGLRRAGR